MINETIILAVTGQPIPTFYHHVQYVYRYLYNLLLFFCFCISFFRFHFLFFQKLMWLYFKKFSCNSLSLSTLFFQIDKTKVESEIERDRSEIKWIRDIYGLCKNVFRNWFLLFFFQNHKIYLSGNWRIFGELWTWERTNEIKKRDEQERELTKEMIVS